MDDDMQKLEQNMASMQPPSSEAQADDRNASPIMRKTSVDLGLWNYVYESSARLREILSKRFLNAAYDVQVPPLRLDLKYILDQKLYVPKSNQRFDTYIDSIQKGLKKALILR